MLCGNFSESKEKKLKLDDVDGRAFIKVLDVWCGRSDCQEVGLLEIANLASVADRFQVTEVEVTSMLLLSRTRAENLLLKQVSLQNNHLFNSKNRKVKLSC